MSKVNSCQMHLMQPHVDAANTRFAWSHHCTHLGWILPTTGASLWYSYHGSLRYSSLSEAVACVVLHCLSALCGPTCGIRLVRLSFSSVRVPSYHYLDVCWYHGRSNDPVFWIFWYPTDIVEMVVRERYFERNSLLSYTCRFTGMHSGILNGCLHWVICH